MNGARPARAPTRFEAARSSLVVSCRRAMPPPSVESGLGRPARRGKRREGRSPADAVIPRGGNVAVAGSGGGATAPGTSGILAINV